MKTLIQKDLRENLKVALIGLLLFSLLLLQAYQSSISAVTNLVAGRWSGQADALQPLLAEGLLINAFFFCALFGAILGWMQTRNEAHRDLWAFLIHRPMTRTAIFWSKTIAGLCLYVFGAGLPIIILIMVARIPGRVAAPFEWEMTAPLLLTFLAGLVYYLAGLLTGLRQARWYGSRVFGLGLAIVASLGLFGGPEPWVILIMIVVAAAILGTAVWGGYLNGGFYRGQPPLGKLALIMTMTAGCGVVLFIGAGLMVSLVLEPLSSQVNIFSDYLMTRDGTIYKTITRDNEVEVTDLNGHPPLDPKTGQKIELKELRKQAAYGGSVYSNFKVRDHTWYGMRNSARFFNLLNINDKTLWYLDRHGKLLGYDGRTRQYIGSLDPHGPDGASSPQPFLRQPTSYYYNSYNDVPRKLLPTAKTVYQIDFRERMVKPVFTLTNDDEIGGYGEESVGYSDSPERNFLITTRQSIRLMDYEGRSIFTVPYQPAYPQYPRIELSLLYPTNTARNAFAVWFYPDGEANRAAGGKMPIHVLWLNPEHLIAQTADLPTLPTIHKASWGQNLAETLLPPFAELEINRGKNSGWKGFSFAIAFISAVIGCSLARRYNFSAPATAGWTLFIFLVGPGGLLVLLCVQEWPARETCPNCKKLRVVDRQFCEHCGSPFPSPEKDGTEIFAPLLKS